MAKNSADDIHAAGFCGDFCGKCPNYPDDCRGCIPEHHPDCPFASCCQERKLEHCGLCVEFPCRKLNDFVPDDRAGCPTGYHIMNLRARVTVGTKAWLEGQWEEWKEKTKR